MLTIVESKPLLRVRSVPIAHFSSQFLSHSLAQRQHVVYLWTQKYDFILFVLRVRFFFVA